jgi:hypothetical protein
MTLPDNPDENKHVQFYSEHIEGSNRQEYIYYENNVHEKIQSSIYAMFDVYLQPNTQIYFRNNTFIDISGLFGGAYIYNSGSVEFNNVSFYNSTDFGFGLLSFEETSGDATIDGFTLSNIVSTGASDTYFFYLYFLEGYSISINNLKVTNTEVNSQALFYLDGVINSFSITNSYFENIKVGTDIGMFSLTELNILNIKNVTFLQISSSTSDDSDNYIIKVGRLYIDGGSNSSVSEIQVENSTIGFFKFDAVENTPTEGKVLTLDDVSITSAYYERSVNLFDFTSIQTAEDFTIRITRVNFQDLSFLLGGNLILMRSQINNGVSVIDSTATNIT